MLDLIENKPGGILDTLDEQCRFPTATAKDFAFKLYQSDYIKESKRFSKPKLSQTAFSINHYAGVSFPDVCPCLGFDFTVSLRSPGSIVAAMLTLDSCRRRYIRN